MSEDLTSAAQRLAATTGFSSNDIVAAMSALKASDALLPEPWSEESMARALPRIVEMATRSGFSLRTVAANVRAASAQVRPDEEPTM